MTKGSVGGGAPSTGGLDDRRLGVAYSKSDAFLQMDGAALWLTASIVPWDTESFGVRVAQVQDIEVRERRAAEREMLRLADWLADHNVELAACRLHNAKLLESAALEGVGFRFIEMVYSMQIDPRSLELGGSSQVDLQWLPASEADRTEIQQLASEAFATGRWNMDWSVGQKLGGRRYADWVGRSMADPRHEVQRAIVDGQTAGLFITEAQEDASVYWHLTAVSPQWQGKGVGKAMWTSMLHRHASDGAKLVHTTIAARNIPVLNLYARLGWRFMDCQMSYHWASSRWLQSRE